MKIFYFFSCFYLPFDLFKATDFSAILVPIKSSVASNVFVNAFFELVLAASVSALAAV